MIHTNNIQRNQVTRPEWYVSPESIEPEVAQYLAWQAKQPNTVGPGTIADAWEAGGTGPLYHANVTRGREEVARWHQRNALEQAAGHPATLAPWSLPQPDPQTACAPGTVPGGAVFGGTVTAKTET